jgi:hypothetical protein
MLRRRAQWVERDCGERICTIATTLLPGAAGYKEDPVISPAVGNGKRSAAGGSTGGGLGFVLGSRAHMQVRKTCLPAHLPAQPWCQLYQQPVAKKSHATPCYTATCLSLPPH